MARKIWLAGIGAYGRAFSEAQESLAKVSEESSHVFNDLVAKGEEIEETVETRSRALAQRVKTPGLSIDERIKQMRARLKIGDDDGDRLDSLETRLAAIEHKLDILLAQTKQPPSKKPAKKASKKKPAVKKRTS